MDFRLLEVMPWVADELDRLADDVDVMGPFVTAFVAKKAQNYAWWLPDIFDTDDETNSDDFKQHYERLIHALNGAARFCDALSKEGADWNSGGTALRSAARIIRDEHHPDIKAERVQSPATDEAQQAQREKIFPGGREGINQDTIDIALDILDATDDNPAIRRELARQHFSGFEDSNERATKALKDIRARESKGRIVLPAKRNRRNGAQ